MAYTPKQSDDPEELPLEETFFPGHQLHVRRLFIIGCLIALAMFLGVMLMLVLSPSPTPSPTAAFPSGARPAPVQPSDPAAPSRSDRPDPLEVELRDAIEAQDWETALVLAQGIRRERGVVESAILAEIDIALRLGRVALAREALETAQTRLPPSRELTTRAEAIHAAEQAWRQPPSTP